MRGVTLHHADVVPSIGSDLRMDYTLWGRLSAWSKTTGLKLGVASAPSAHANQACRRTRANQGQALRVAAKCGQP